MSNAPGAVAKALLDALPTLDFNKIVNETRKSYNIAVLGDPAAVAAVCAVLRGRAVAPEDVKVAVWSYEPGGSAPANTGKTEFAIVVPATEQTVRTARDVFAGAQLILVTVGGAAAPEGGVKAVNLPEVDERQVRRILVPHLVDRLWDRRLSLGRSVPGTRDHIAGRLTRNAAKEPKILLGSVASASNKRSGAPTPATALVMVHQAVLIVSMAAIYGLDLEDQAAIYARVAPSLAPTILMDGLEATISRFAEEAGKGSGLEKIAGPAAAYIARPTLTASSTLLAGITARRIFRGMSETHEAKPSPTERTKAAGKRLMLGAGHAVAVAGGAVAMRVRRDKQPQPADAPADETAERDLPEAAPGDATATPSGQELE
jgi:hypothetical protein